VFVFIFFGLVAVVGTAVLQSGRLEWLYVAAAVPVGALTTAILVVNNLRDTTTDRAAGKRTLSVTFGEGFARAEYVVCLLVAWAVVVGLLIVRLAGGAGAATAAGAGLLLPLLALPMARPLIGVVYAEGDPRRLNPVLRGTARLTLAFAILFAAGLALGR
jgi:1,4-dihydroxy-2-naphthoate octaprenyltransferase